MLYPHRRAIAIGAVLVTAGLLAAACGGGSKATTTTTTSTPSASSAASSATVDMHSTPAGMVLATSSGMTLYVTSLDKSSASKCNGACTALWPPFTVSGTPKAGSGVNQSMLGTTTRSDGTRQVTYAGHPLYRFSGDQSAGQDHGENLTDAFGHWTALNASGQKVTAPASSTTAPSNPNVY